MRRPKPGWEFSCCHANEVPRVCPCPETCGCRYYNCKTVVEKDETGLKSKLMAQIKIDLPGFLAIRHEDVRSSGIPDMSLSGYGRTSWWEFKHGTPKFDTFDLQELTMCRLAVTSYARYIIFQENKFGQCKQTLIIHPRHLDSLTPEARCVGYDFRFLTDFFRSVHR